jgi:hypothetical protein
VQCSNSIAPHNKSAGNYLRVVTLALANSAANSYQQLLGA